jgi:uncharacterized protein YjiS (DUF1127 family)
MSATAITTARPVAAKRPGTLSRFFGACWNAVAGHLVRRSAVATLRELDDRALADIGISRGQIEAAVHGFVPLSDRGRIS